MAAWALVHIAPDAETIKTAIPILSKALAAAPNPQIRAEMAKSLGEIGAGSAVAKDALELALKDSDTSVRKAAEASLVKLK